MTVHVYDVVHQVTQLQNDLTMTQEHPITPPEELVSEWWSKCTATSDNLIGQLATQAARWGADQELEACCAWFLREKWNPEHPANLRDARRPKPPSHKELALIALTALEACAAQSSDTTESVFYIRRALESLPD